MLHICLDVDGTLEGFDGVVTRELCLFLKKKGATLWMLSGRDTETEADWILKRFELKQAKMIPGKDYVEIKTKSLQHLKETETNMNVPVGDRYPYNREDDVIVYVGDRVDDFYVAMRAGVIYCNASVLTLDILKESKNKALKAIL